GDGTFAERQVLTTGTMPSSAVTADLNRDRAADLVSANLLSGDVSVVLNESPAKVLCTGDCDEQGSVGINELVRSVSIALGQTSLDDCLAADGDGDGNIEINELVAAVGHALDGCS